jgi:hypothetical protein
MADGGLDDGSQCTCGGACGPTPAGARESRMSGRIQLVADSLVQLDTDLAARILSREEHEAVAALLLAALGPDSRPAALVVAAIPHQRDGQDSDTAGDDDRDLGADLIQVATWQSRRPRELLGFLAREYLRGRLARDRYVALRRAVAVVASLSGQPAVAEAQD